MSGCVDRRVNIAFITVTVTVFVRVLFHARLHLAARFA